MKSIYVFRCLAMATLCTTFVYEKSVEANPICDSVCFDNLFSCRQQANRNYNACVNALNPQTTAGIQACATQRLIHISVCDSIATTCLYLCDQQEAALEDARELIRATVECGREGD